jgi:nitrite reductase (cytochrome c-552)
MTQNDQPSAATPDPAPKPWRPRVIAFVGLMVLTAAAAAAITALLVTIFWRKAEALHPFVRVVEVDNNTSDPSIWARNWPQQYDSYIRTAEPTRTRFGGHGGSESLPEQKIERDPWLKRMFLGYAFSIDYRDRRGHAYMLADQEQTERITKRPQPGACLHCHSSVVPTYRRVGLEARRQPLTSDFNWPAVMEGFRLMSTMTYTEAHAELYKTPDGSGIGRAHPISCVDCHDPRDMQLRVTRPGFVLGIQALARSDAPVPHLPSIERWRRGDRSKEYDPNVDGMRQEMRSFVCAQCHVEYYCGPRQTLFYPWDRGLKMEQIEAMFDNHRFPDGELFYDYKHAETGALIYKAQHPEFELWSQGIHARSGVSCSDCHMPYQRVGATKVSDHWVRSPLLNVSRACQTCHRVEEREIFARVDAIQDRNHDLLQRSARALMDMMDAIAAARKAGASDERIQPALDLQRKAQWRLDFIAAENSMGFHAPQEAARILGEAIDYARQGQVAAQSAAAAAR